MCEREDGWWIVTSQSWSTGPPPRARTLDEVPATVADLVATMTGADPAAVEVHVKAHEGPGLAAKFGLMAVLAGLAAAGARAIRDAIRAA